MWEEQITSMDTDGMSAERVISFIAYIAPRRVRLLSQRTDNNFAAAIVISCLEEDGITPRYFNTGQLPLNTFQSNNQAVTFPNMLDFLTQWYVNVRRQMTEYNISDTNGFFTDNESNFINFAITLYHRAAIGCTSKRHNRIEKLIKQGYATAIESNGNCVQECVKLSTGLRLVHSEVKDVATLATQIQSHICVYTLQPPTYTKLFLLEEHNDRKLIPTHMVIMNDHADLLIVKNHQVVALKYEYCESCKRWNTPEHCRKCVRCGCGRSFTNVMKHKLTCKHGKASLVVCQPNNKAPEDLTKMVHFCDLETFVERKKMHLPYMACIKSINEDEVHCFSGLNCMNQLIDYMMRLSGMIYFYNGSAFDGFFLIEPWLTRYGDKVYDLNSHHKDILSIKNNRIYQLTMKRKPRLVVKDLYLMFPAGTSLKNAAESFAKDKAQKTEFDYSKIQSWADIPHHYDEVAEYCKQDVRALEAVFTGYNNLSLELFKLSIYQHLTLPSLSYSVFASLQESKHLMKTQSGAHYEMCRGALFGGRVSPQKPYFFSKDYDASKVDEDGTLSKEEFDKIQDYIQQWDEVSQYANVMGKEDYPTGTSHILSNPAILKQRADDMNNGRFPESSFKRIIAEVDVTCPKDLITPYLMSRTAKGMEQNLLDKTKQLYTGIDLMEAIELGYRITKIHRMLVFTQCENIFKKFIDICFNGKKNSPKNSAAYQLYKYIMNSASGKFAQKLIDSANTILCSKKILEQGGYSSNTKELTLLKHDDTPYGVLVCYKKDDKDITPMYPSHITAFITSYARRHISRMVRMFNGYKNGRYAFFYTDTDSLVLHHEVEPMIRDVIGKDLGELDDELDGGKGVEAIFLSKKSYVIRYFKRPTAETNWRAIMEQKIRCKGIPHTNMPLRKKDYVIDEDWKKKHLNIYSTKDQYVELKTRFYVTTSKKGKVSISKHLDIDHFMDAMIGSKTVEVCYANLKRQMKGKKENSISLTAGWLGRRLVGDDGHFWMKGTRQWVKEDQVSYPMGHVKYEIS